MWELEQRHTLLKDTESVGRMLRNLIRSLQARTAKLATYQPIV